MCAPMFRTESAVGLNVYAGFCGFSRDLGAKNRKHGLAVPYMFGARGTWIRTCYEEPQIAQISLMDELNL